MNLFNKTILSVAALAFSVSAFANDFKTSGEEIPTKEVVVGLNDVFVPGGFDSEADSYVVVSGVFPNGCYKWKGADVKSAGFSHEIVSKATVSQGMCLMVLVPFTKDVKLGKLDSGKHTLRFLNGDGTYFEKNLVIE